MPIVSRALLLGAPESACNISVAALDVAAHQRKPMAKRLPEKRHPSSEGRLNLLAKFGGLAALLLLGDFFTFGGDNSVLGDWFTFSLGSGCIPEIALTVGAALLLVTRTNVLASVVSPSCRRGCAGGTRRVQLSSLKRCNTAGDTSSTCGRVAPVRRRSWCNASALTLPASGDVVSQRTEAIIHAARASEKEKAEQLLLELEDSNIKPPAACYNCVIRVCAKCGDADAAEKWFHRMVAAGIQPDALNFNSVIHACVVNGAIARAGLWLEDMESRGFVTSVGNSTVAYTELIDACAKRGDIDGAENWFGRMIEKGVEPNDVTFSAMIASCAKVGNRARAEAWFEKMVERGIAPCAYSYGAVMNACAKQGGPGSAEAAEKWLDHAEQAGVNQDSVLYCTAINACVRSGHAEDALRIFNRMQASGLRANIVAYAALARGFAQRGDWMKVESIASDMTADGVTMNDFFLNAQLLSYALARSRQSERAEACFRSAFSVGIKANDQIVGVVCRAVGRVRCGQLMEELCGGRRVPGAATVGVRSSAAAGPSQAKRRRPSIVQNQ